MADNKEKLFDMFPPVSTEEWMAKINVDLKGADFNKKLVWRTNEGFNVQPFYRREDIKDLPAINTLPGEYPYLRGTRDNNDWLIRQFIPGETAEEFNRNAIHAIDRGVESLGVKLCGDVTEADLEKMFEGIDLAKIEVNISCCPGKAPEIAKVFVAFIQKKGVADAFRGSFDFNPFKRLLKHGLVFPKDIKEQALAMYEAVKDVKGIRCFAVDGGMLNNAGAYITQELGYSLAWGAEWLTLLTEAGLKPLSLIHI